MELILEFLFCCQFSRNQKILDLLEDLATMKRKCPFKLEKFGDDYRQIYINILNHFKLEDFEENNQQMEIRNWSSIRKKAVKDFILKNFIIEVKYTYEFDEKTTCDLKRDLGIGLNFKNVNDKNIIIKDNKIVKIVGLNLFKNRFTWDFDIFQFA